VGVQEVRWDNSGTERAEDYAFLYAEGNEDHDLVTGVYVNKKIMSAVRREEFVIICNSNRSLVQYYFFQCLHLV
jgi:hypothetical protein